LKILAIGDPHAKRNNSLDIRLLKERIIELALKEKPDKIVILGDLANDFAKMHLAAWQEIIAFIDAVVKLAPSIYYIVGNHDYENNTAFLSDSHFFNVFKGKYDNLTVVDTVIPETEGGINIVYLPYVPPGRFKEALETGEVKDVYLIFCHQEFRGSKMGAIESKIGDEWPKSNPMVVSGHIHDRDFLQPNILFAGAPYQTGFGDSSKKSVEIITINAQKDMEFTPVDLGMPKKITLKVDVEKFKEVDITEENRYRINVTGTSEELHKLKKTKKYKELKKFAKIIPRPTDKLVKKLSTRNKDFSQILSDSIKKESETVIYEYDKVMEND